MCSTSGRKYGVAGLLEKKHRSIIQGQNDLKAVRDVPLQWERVVADVLETFEVWMPLDNFDNAEWIRRQWVEMFLKKCSSEIGEARKTGRQGNKQLGTDLGERASNKARSNLPQLPNTTFMVVSSWVSDGKNMVLAPKQLQASYTDVRHWEELIDFLDKNRGLKERYIMSSMIKCTLEQDELEEEYMGLYTHGRMIMDPIYGQILYNCCLSKAFKLKLGHNPKRILVEIQRSTAKETSEHLIRPTKVNPARRVKGRRAQSLFIIH